MIGVDKYLTNRKRILLHVTILQRDRHKRPGHGTGTGQEQRSAFLDEAGELVADGIHTQVGSVVAHADGDHGGAVAVAA